MSSHSAYPDDPIALAFAPAHKSAMGAAVGLTAAVCCFLLTAVPLLRGRPPELQLELLANYFYGYDFTWGGAVLGAAWAGFTGYDDWMARANNASLALQAAYDALVPAFERVFEQQGGDFARFHAEVARLAGLPRDQRRATLQALAPEVVLPP